MYIKMNVFLYVSYACLNRSPDYDETLGNAWTHACEGFWIVLSQNKALKIGSNRDLVSAD